MKKLGVALLALMLSGAAFADKKVHEELVEKYKPEQVTDHVWVIHGPTGFPSKENGGFMNNPGFVVTEEAVAVIDPGSSAHIGRAVLKQLRTITDKPVTHVFTTHVHGDHWLGNVAFKEDNADAKFYGHPAMIEKANGGDADTWLELMDSMTEGATEGTEAVIATEALENGQELKVGDVTIKAHIGEGKAHTATDVMYEVVEDKVIFTGDNINNKRIVRMDDGSFPGSVSAAEHALSLGVEKVVPGHGMTTGPSVLKYYRDYLDTVYSSVKELRDDMEAFEMKPEIEKKLKAYEDTKFTEWEGYETELGKHISLSVTEAEMEDF